MEAMPSLLLQPGRGGAAAHESLQGTPQVGGGLGGRDLGCVERDESHEIDHTSQSNLQMRLHMLLQSNTVCVCVCVDRAERRGQWSSPTCGWGGQSPPSPPSPSHLPHLPPDYRYCHLTTATAT